MMRLALFQNILVRIALEGGRSGEGVVRCFMNGPSFSSYSMGKTGRARMSLQVLFQKSL